MLNTISMDHEDIPAIRDAMNSVKYSENVLRIRRGAQIISRDRWIELIETECDLIPDRRHFAPQWAANDARRNAIKHRVATGEAIAETDLAVDEQIKPADWWEISYQPEREIAYAYSKTPQPLHTDNAWFADPAEINFFIMDKQAISGGDQTLYPVSRVVEDLAAKAPALLNDLTTMQVSIGKGDNDMVNRTTVIRLTPQPQIFWNYYRTDKSSPEVSAMCEAFFEFLKQQTETTSVERVHCETADCLSFNDLHMLHGRTAFEASNPRDRVLLHSMWKLPEKS